MSALLTPVLVSKCLNCRRWVVVVGRKELGDRWCEHHVFRQCDLILQVHDAQNLSVLHELPVYVLILEHLPGDNESQFRVVFDRPFNFGPESIDFSVGQRAMQNDVSLVVEYRGCAFSRYLIKGNSAAQVADRHRKQVSGYALRVTPKSRFVSYAQNMEDVVLSRLVPSVPHGRFIDVGAGHPILENVTYALYLQGWRGINVEPMQKEAALLREERPEDEAIQAAVGATSGSVTLFEAPAENRGATTSSAELAGRYALEGERFVPFEARMITLSSLLSKFEAGEVHVVKVDVEGMESDVLGSADLQRHRPWVVVVESTEPNSSISTAHRWEHLVLEGGYRLTLFDGLNRFYVRSDLEDIQTLLSVPANVFDGWTPSIVVELEMDNAAKEEYIASLLSEFKALRAAALEAERYAKALENAVADMRAAKNK